MAKKKELASAGKAVGDLVASVKSKSSKPNGASLIRRRLEEIRASVAEASLKELAFNNDHENVELVLKLKEILRQSAFRERILLDNQLNSIKLLLAYLVGSPTSKTQVVFSSVETVKAFVRVLREAGFKADLIEHLAEQFFVELEKAVPGNS